MRVRLRVGGEQVVGFHYCKVTDDIQERKEITDWYGKIRADRRFEKSLVITFIEANLTQIGASAIANYMGPNTPGRLYHVSRDPTKEKRIGVWKTNLTTRRYVRDVNLSLAFDYIHISERLILTGDHALDPPKAISNLFRKLKLFRLVTQKMTSEAEGFRDPKITATGKNGTKESDDITIAFCMLVYFSRIAEYSEHIRQNIVGTDKRFYLG